MDNAIGKFFRITTGQQHNKFFNSTANRQFFRENDHAG